MSGRAKRRGKRLISVIGRNQYRLASSSKNLAGSLYSRLNSTRKLILNRIKKWQLKDRGVIAFRKVIKFVDRKPLTSFLSTLGIFLVLITIGNLLSRPIEEPNKKGLQKVVSIYSIGEAPQMSFQAKIEKTGVIKIIAQAPGIVQSINVVEGQAVDKNTTLIQLSNNYQGGNIAALQASLAGQQYENAKNTYDLQKDLIFDQRQIAEKTDLNQDVLRLITAQSIESTQSLLNLNENVLTTLNDQQKQLESTNIGGANDQQLLQIKQLISQLQAGTNQLHTNLQQAQYSVPFQNPPAQLSNLQKEATLKQLTLQEKSLALSLETSRIQYQISLVNQALFFPAAPFNGVVERIHVFPGQSVNPGTELITLNGQQSSKAVVKVPKNVAQNISKSQSSKLYIGKKTLELSPYYISHESTDGQLYSVLFAIPSTYQNNLANNSFIKADLPVGNANTSASIPYIPIDAVYQSQDKSYVYINDNNIAKAKTVELGPVFGNFVEVIKGLSRSDQIILNRTVVSGDKIKISI